MMAVQVFLMAHRVDEPEAIGVVLQTQGAVLQIESRRGRLALFAFVCTRMADGWTQSDTVDEMARMNH